jgi:hypothetical protein
MPRFTCIVVDREQSQYYDVIVEDRNADDAADRAKHFLYDEAVPEYGGEKDAPAFDDFDVEVLFVAIGDHPNLITPDTSIERKVVPSDYQPKYGL